MVAFLCPVFPSSGVVPTMQLGAFSGFPTTGHDDGRCDKFFIWFYELNLKTIEQVKDVCMIVLRLSSEDLYDSCLVGIFVWLCVKLFLYVGLYENLDLED